jgi:sterol desaturase/sphingolipid hydroxylase (fatty acid hydroxylase superfamily)
LENGGIVSDHSRDWQRRRRRRIGTGVALVLVALLVAGLALDAHHAFSALNGHTAQTVSKNVWAGWRAAVLNPWYWGLVCVFLVMERLWPAQPGGGIVTVGGAQDLVWILMAPFFTLTIVALWAAILDVMYTEVFGGAGVHLTSYIGVFPTAVVAFLLSDFLFWFTHWVRHKVPTFWYFHAVHHAAPNLNTLTDNRVHFVEAMISATIVLIPARFLGLSAPAAFALVVATTYFTAWTHTAIRTNMGPLRYVLVTPQYHRVHHSHSPEHIDVNFGTVFSFWDRMFRTQYQGWDEYPQTGIADQKFPLEDRLTPGRLVKTYFAMVFYPFRQMAGDVGKFRRPALDPTAADD